MLQLHSVSEVPGPGRVSKGVCGMILLGVIAPAELLT